MKKCKFCGKAMKDSDLFCPRCAREYREDRYETKSQVESIFTIEGFEQTKTRELPKIKLGKGFFVGVFVIIFMAAFPPIAPLLIFIGLASLANKIKKGQ